VGRSDILIDGYMDWVTDNDQTRRGTYHANLHFNPQVKYDLGKALNLGAKQLTSASNTATGRTNTASTAAATWTATRASPVPDQGPLLIT
jgi:nucleoside-specific outer membrane channel protein Tsx